MQVARSQWCEPLRPALCVGHRLLRDGAAHAVLLRVLRRHGPARAGDPLAQEPVGAHQGLRRLPRRQPGAHPPCSHARHQPGYLGIVSEPLGCCGNVCSAINQTALLPGAWQARWLHPCESAARRSHWQHHACVLSRDAGCSIDAREVAASFKSAHGSNACFLPCSVSCSPVMCRPAAWTTPTSAL